MWFAADRLPGQPNGHGAATALAFPMPSTVTHFFNSDSGAQWQSTVYQTWAAPGEDKDPFGIFKGPWTEYQPGRSYAETWNQAVFGPTLPSPDSLSTGVTRTGDTIGVDLPLLPDLGAVPR
jgi:hypothetical protein